MSKHTQGPWTMHGPCEITGRYSIVHNGPLAYVGDANQSGDGEANARLIAAAPEMLDALHELVKYLGVDVDNGLDELLTNARAAIAKATGEEI